MWEKTPSLDKGDTSLYSAVCTLSVGTSPLEDAGHRVKSLLYVEMEQEPAGFTSSTRGLRAKDGDLADSQRVTTLVE